MKKCFSLPFLIGVILSIMSTGCSKAMYEAKPLTALKSAPKVQEKVEVVYKVLSKEESLAYLGINWSKKGIIALQLSIENFSDEPLRFSRKGISLPTIDLQTIKLKAHGNTDTKAMLLCAPSVTCVTLGMIGLAFAPATLGASAAAVPLAFGIGGIHTASKWVQQDYKFDEDYHRKFLSDKDIPAHGIVEGIVFVPKEQFIEGFKVKIQDPKTQKVLFVQAMRCNSIR